jgi:hypothetical protein
MKLLNLKFGLLFIIVFSIIFFSKHIFAYDETLVHPSLTVEAAKLYNLNYVSNKLTDSEIEWIRQGSIDEDQVAGMDGLPIRSTYHFYNPLGAYKWADDTTQSNNAPFPKLTSEEWAHNSFEQSKYTGGSYTWEQAIWDYSHGESERAYVGLGHILHLIEDATVPAHTRSDFHVSLPNMLGYEGGEREPYEDWTRDKAKSGEVKFDFAEKLHNENQKISNYLSLDGFFDELAKYSNNNFFSKDTINAYVAPKKYVVEGSELLKSGRVEEYVYGLDENNEKIKLAKIISIIDRETNKLDKFYTLTKLGEEVESSVYFDYWSHLTPKSVLAGAGIINLFKIEAEKAKNNPSSVEKPLTTTAVSYYLTDPVNKTAGEIKSTTVIVYDYGKTQVIAVYDVTRSTIVFVYNIAVSIADAAKTFVIKTSNDIIANATLIKNNVSDLLQKTADSIASGIAKMQNNLSNSLAWMASTASGNIFNILDSLKNINNNNNFAASIVPASGDNQIAGDAASGTNVSNDEHVTSLSDALSDAVNNANNNGDSVLVQSVDSQNNNELTVNVAEISEADAARISEALQLVNDQEPDQSTDGQIVTPLDMSEDIQSQILASQSRDCSFGSSQIPTRQKIIINEVAWMGGSETYSLTSNDEWIELKNISTETVDISNWQMLDEDEQIKVKFGSNAKINPNGFYLLERTDDSSVPNVAADMIYSGALSNSNEGLRFFDGQCNLADEALAIPSWPAGDAMAKRTMERESNFNWHTFNGNAVERIFGSPKGENSAVVVNSFLVSGGSASVSQTNESNNQPVKILINEVQAYPVENRFIELYNPNNSSVDLTSWYLQRKTQSGASFGSLVSKTYFEGKTINANGYFLISRNALTGADIILDDLTLTESNTIQIKNSNGEMVDKLGWGVAIDCENSCASEPSMGQSIQRKFNSELSEKFIDTGNNADDFEVKICPSPKAQSAICEEEKVNEAPVALFNFTPADPAVGDSIAFNAGSSTDPDGDVVSYEWDFGNGDSLKNTDFIANYSYPEAGDYQVALTVFDDKNASSTKTSSISIKKGGTNHVVISEIQAGTDAGSDDEFIELYNPTNQVISLDGWELRKKTSSGSETNLVDDGSFIGSIDPKSFFLIVNKNYKGLKAEDLFYSTGTDIAYSDNSIVLYDGDYKTGAIIDEVSYVDVPKNRSFERKAFFGDQCVSAGGDGEYSGNSCDTDNAADFEIRNIPNPQNSESLPEPREVQTNLSMDNWNVAYDSTKLSINFSWPEEESLIYEIKEYENDAPVSIYKDSAAGFVKKIDEVGRKYKFSIQAFDEEGMGGSLIEKEIDLPSFIKDVSFYKASHRNFNNENIDEPLVEFSYDNYPFLPLDLVFMPNGMSATGPNSKIIVFYLNGEAPKDEFLEGAGPPKNITDVLHVSYKDCYVSDVSFRPTLILADSLEGCSSYGGSIDYLKYINENDNHLLFPARKKDGSVDFSVDDYFTVAYYGFFRNYPQGSDSSFALQNFKLLAVDKNHYKFSEDKPPRSNPSAPGNLQFSLDQGKAVLKTSWDKSSDPDTLDSLLKYEISYNDSPWKSVDSLLYDKKVIEPGVTYNIKIRAVDDFGIASDEAGGLFSVPADGQPLFGVSNMKWGYIDESPDMKVSFDYQNYPFMPDSDGNQFDVMIFYLNDLPPLSHEYYALTLNYVDSDENDPYPRLMTSHKSCAFGEELFNFSSLILARSGDSVSSYTNEGVLMPNRCNWDNSMKGRALVPAPSLGQSGTISLPVIGLAKSNTALNDLSATDYITVGFYAIDQWNNAINIGNDTHKYFFQGE